MSLATANDGDEIDGNLTHILHKMNCPFKGNHYYSLYLKSVPTDGLKVNIEAVPFEEGESAFKEGESASLTINPLIKYEPVSDTTGNSIIPFNPASTEDQPIIDRIIQLDADNIFDYSYQVPADIVIENPLIAKTFLDAQHIYNQYTICEWDLTDMDKISLTNKIKGGTNNV